MNKSLLLFACLSLLTLSACNDNGELPPDNGRPLALSDRIIDLEAKGRSTILNPNSDITGPDLDGNGISDDVDAYINKLDLTEPQRNAVR